jgi:hypothetical protein
MLSLKAAEADLLFLDLSDGLDEVPDAATYAVELRRLPWPDAEGIISGKGQPDWTSANGPGLD